MKQIEKQNVMYLQAGGMNLKHKRISHLLIIILMIIWGGSYLSIKVIVAEIDPTLSAFYRFTIAATILFSILRIKYPQEKILREDRLLMALSGLTGVAMYFFFENYSVAYTSASNVAVLISSIPVFTLISQRIAFKEKITVLKFSGAMLSAVGIVVIIASKERISLFSTGTRGDLMALAAAFCWVIYNVITSKFKGNYKSITVSAHQILWGCIFLSPALFFNKLTVPSLKVISNTLFLAVICSCIGYIIYIYCLEHLGATIVTTYINLQPIVTLIFAKIILRENITLWQVGGSVIIIVGVFLVSFGEKFNIRKFEDML